MRRTVRTTGSVLPTLLLLLGLAACGPAAKTPPSTAPEEPAAEGTEPPTIADVTLGPGDEIEVSVWRNPDFGGRYVVDPAGKIFIPVVGSVETAGVGITDLRQAITNSLHSYLKDPQVTLTVVNFRSHKFFVLGEVERPGIFYLSGENVSLVQAIALSGGLTPDAKSKQIFRIPASGPQGRIESFDVARLFKEGDVSQNVTIANGDLIYVPRTTIANVDRFFEHLRHIFEPMVWLERAIILGPYVGDAVQGHNTPVLLNSN